MQIFPGATPANRVRLLQGHYRYQFTYAQKGAGARQWRNTWPFPNRIPDLIRLEIIDKRGDVLISPPMIVAIAADAELSCLSEKAKVCSPKSGGDLAGGAAREKGQRREQGRREGEEPMKSPKRPLVSDIRSRSGERGLALLIVLWMIVGGVARRLRLQRDGAQRDDIGFLRGAARALRGAARCRRRDCRQPPDRRGEGPALASGRQVARRAFRGCRVDHQHPRCERAHRHQQGRQGAAAAPLAAIRGFGVQRCGFATASCRRAARVAIEKPADATDTGEDGPLTSRRRPCPSSTSRNCAASRA